MAEKLFDSNTSFGVLRTNPKLTGNFKITLDSDGGVWLNSLDSSPELSLQKYKKFRVTGNSSYAKDVYNFFGEGSVSNDVIFEVARNTRGENQAAETFSQQYDFFYGAGASTLIDKNYPENFKYFQPLWIRDVLPEFFVIFKVPDPLSYPYPTNVTNISSGTQYKVIQEPGTTTPFIVKYWNPSTSSFQNYTTGEFFTGNSVFSTYDVVQGSGVVTEMDELKYYNEVNDVQSFFNSKILPYAKVVATFDLRSNTQIGKYIRSIVNDPGFSPSPINFSLQANTFTYYNGISITEGVFTRKGEILNDYLKSTRSTPQIDFEEYITNGFSRNGIVCPNLLNMEFLFNDPDSNFYTINRYLGFYVSRNDLAEFKFNGDFFYQFRNQTGNLNLPKPARNSIGYYYDQSPTYQSSTGGVRLYYEGASGWMPGSEDVNVLDSQKLYYIADREDNFYSLARFENYSSGVFGSNIPEYLQFGPYYRKIKGIQKAYSLWSPTIGYQNVTIVTDGNHGFEDNSIVTITGSAQQIDGSWNITIPSGATGNSFQIPVILTSGDGVVQGSTGYIPGSTANYVDNSVWTEQKVAGGFFFGTTGSSVTKTGSLVISNKKVNLSNFTGPYQNLGSFLGSVNGQKGRAYVDVTFEKTLDLDKPVTFKIFWPNGSRGPLGEKYDLVTSGDYAGTLSGWTNGSFYSTGDNHYFNWFQGGVSDFSKAFNGAVSDISTVVWDTGSSFGTSIIRIKNPGQKLNSQYSITVFSDYASFESNYAGLWNNKSAYSVGQIVVHNGVYYEASSPVPSNSFGTNPPPSNSVSWTLYYPFEYPGYVQIAGVDASEISYIQSFVGGTDYSKNRVVFSSDESEVVKVGNWIQVEPGKGITGGLSMISSVTRYVDSPIYDNNLAATTGTVTGFRGFNESLVANLTDSNAVISLGSDSRFNVFNMVSAYLGVFSFFDVKDFNFDFWSSSYGITPTPEFHRYFQLIPNQEGQIVPGEKYYVRRGSISYRANNFPVINNTVNEGEIFITTFATSFQDLLLNGQSAIVLPAAFTRVLYRNAVGYAFPPANYGPPENSSEQDLNNFPGFYGIQSIITDQVTDENVKQTVFEYGKLESEYQYLEENYTATRANRSRIVPYINKWGYRGGTDARGNIYRLNVSPAFSPTNFSPGFQQDNPNPEYLTHEWMVLEGVPRQYPPSSISTQNNYLPGKVDIDKIRNASPSEESYFIDRFTVDPEDYPVPYANTTSEVKEFFTPLYFNSTTGFYETVFRGVKISLSRRSTLPNPQNDLEKFVRGYRGFEGYNFSAILRVVPEDNTTVQPPVSYEVIENVTQKCILFVIYAVVKDYRALPLGYTGPTGSNPYLDYLLMYSLKSKKKLNVVGPTANSVPLYSISDIKLSSSLDLSFASLSECSPSANGQIYIVPNSDYDTDLTEEINLFYPSGFTGATGPIGSPSATGSTGSFVAYVNSTENSLYPWPIGRAKNLVNFGPTNPNNYYFDISFAPTPSPVLDIPVGSQGIYAGKPVTQIGGGENYFTFLMKRLSLSHIANKVNTNSPYIKYKTYIYNEVTSQTELLENYFELDFIQPTAIYKPRGLEPAESFTGPQTLGRNQPTGYEIVNTETSFPADILRYPGGYEPLFRKVILFKGDKDDTVSGDPSVDLSYRNCTFAPEKDGFGLIENLNYTKVSLGKNILEGSQNLPQGPVYPLIGQTPIAKKNFSVFLSTWDPGYYNLYSSSTDQSPVAGTRSMLDYKTFFGSKIMQTPGEVTTYTFITLEISRVNGTLDPQVINSEARASLSAIQSMTPSQSGTGIGQLGPALVPVDLFKLDESIYPDIEVFWQYDPVTRIVYGVIRLDRILKRYLLSSGIEKVFVENMISEFGVGDPNSIQDDVLSYIQQNVLPIYEGRRLDLLVLKKGSFLYPGAKLVTGDLIGSDKIKYGYVPQSNFSLTQRTSLTYQFEYSLDQGQNYSLTFNFTTGKI